MTESVKSPYVYYMFHKPSGCVTANRDERHITVMDYMKEVIVPGLHPVGRLDKDTEGLLLFTNDGVWTQSLMNPENHVEKTYFFWSMGEISDEAVKELEAGVMMRGGQACPARFLIEKKGILGEIRNIATGIKPGNRPDQPVFSGYLTIYEGRKHQVKRMIRAIGGYVVYLKRISIGNLVLDEGLQPGEFRELSLAEKQLAFH